MHTLNTKTGKLIGITGGVGSGKSTVLNYLKEMYDCEIMPADNIALDLEKKGEECYAPLVSLLSEDILGADGEIDKAKMSALIFNDEELLKAVNAIVHPAVKRYVENRLNDIRRLTPEKTVILESAIFVEAGYLDILDELWLVSTDPEARKGRLKATRGYSDEKCEAIISNQFSDAEYASYADHIIKNNGTKEELYKQIDSLMTEPVFGLDIGTRSVVGTVGYMKGGLFYVIAEEAKEHDTRAMLDGQIHDVNRVSATIREVKKALEEKCGFELKRVCIAAAGRVLKTITVHEDLDFEADILIEGEEIYELQSAAVEKAYTEFEKQSDDKYYLVGASVIKQYLNGSPIGNLENQKGHNIGMDVIATFLPEEVIDGLYRAVELADLEVSNLTLEPIAASMVAIPEKFRMLNISLVDVGAGTSDSCITEDGAVPAYGMIPYAGDAFTEVIAKHCLVDFNTAEEIKKGISENESVEYTDIMGLVQKISAREILDLIRPVMEDMAKKVSDEIIRLNGGKPVSAIFVVGGGGMVKGYAELLADAMNIPIGRVALRGEELMTKFVFSDKNIVHNSLYVTPLGICLNYYEQNNNFIYVTVNGEKVKLYNNGNLHVADALMQMAIPNENVFPKRGRTIRFTVNGEIRLLKGGLGEAAVVKVNDEDASIHTVIRKNDRVSIVFSTKGTDAVCHIRDLAQYKKMVDEPVVITVNNHKVTADYDIQDGDVISILPEDEASDYSYEEESVLADSERLRNESYGEIRTEEILSEEKTDSEYYGDFPDDIETGEEAVSDEDTSDEGAIFEAGDKTRYERNGHRVPYDKPIPMVKHDAIRTGFKDFPVIVNGNSVIMRGKEKYIFVDIFDYIDFDLKSPKGRKIVTKVNSVNVANYMQELPEGAVIEIYWDN